MKRTVPTSPRTGVASQRREKHGRSHSGGRHRLGARGHGRGGLHGPRPSLFYGCMGPEGVEVLAGALAQWRGALPLVSHGDGFGERVGLDEVITLP